MSWEDVKKEMVNEKGLSEEAANQIGEYVSMQGKTGPQSRRCSLLMEQLQHKELLRV